MDYYQGVVIDYLRADRSVFVNTECLIQLNQAPNPDTSGPHWYCDAVAADFGTETIFLCEISYAEGLTALLKRLSEWNTHWEKVCAALIRDCTLPAPWLVRPWLFIPEKTVPIAVSGIRKIQEASAVGAMPVPRVTTLERVTPWQYRAWNRQGENEKPGSIPAEMAR